MERFVNELKKIIPFKETTESGDIVLIAAQEPKSVIYAHVGEIVRDSTRKAEWWHVTLHLLTIPLQTVIWTLRTEQLTGRETFTMGGEGRFVKAVDFSRKEMPSSGAPPPKDPIPGKKPGLRVVK